MNQKSKVISPEELARQQMFSAYNRDLLLKKYGRQPLACPVTFGCQQNEADTELIRGMLVDMGYGFTDQVEKADFVLFNTCAIREHAEQRVFGNVGEVTHLKNHNPNIMIAVCGCMAQQQHIADKTITLYNIYVIKKNRKILNTKKYCYEKNSFPHFGDCSNFVTRHRFCELPCLYV